MDMSARAAPETAGPFVPAVIVGVILVGFLAFIAYVVLNTFESDFRNGDDGGAHALSKSAVGYAGLVSLLNAAGRPTVVAKGDLGTDINRRGGVMVLTIDAGDPHTQLGDLPTTRRFGGLFLEVMPKWETVPALHRGWIRRTGVRQVDADTWIGPPDRPAPPTRPAPNAARTPVLPYMPKILLGHASGKARHTLTLIRADGPPVSIQTGEIENFQTFERAIGWTPLIVDETGHMVLGYMDGQSDYALSEPDLFNNHGIADINNARAALFVIDAMPSSERLFFDVTLNGFERSRSMLKLMLQPPFLAATLCALAATLLMIWHAMYRFGAPRQIGRALALGKQALADNQAGLIRMAGREARMGGRYADIVRGLAARAVSAPRDLAGDALTVFLDRLGAKGRTRDTLSDLKAVADGARTRSELMDAAARLHRWRLEMTREPH